MIGSLRWNFILGAIGGVVTFLLSVANNLLLSALLHSLYAFVILFVLGFALRFALKVTLSLNTGEPVTDSDAGKGTRFDAVTPQESEDLHDLLKSKPNQQEEEGFLPLAPTKLSTKLPDSPENMAHALRRMSE
ncbi:hypothetical protein [Paenibacillus sp. y28]|uniref:hypothetical protein n=1 Tax=Paenibacillus sp. y28 TaxID=3129110 RepID=UPI003017F8E1